VVRDRDFAGELRDSLYEAMMDGAREIFQADLALQPLHKQLFSWLSYGLVRAMVGITGYGPKHWQADEETPGTTPTE